MQSDEAHGGTTATYLDPRTGGQVDRAAPVAPEDAGALRARVAANVRAHRSQADRSLDRARGGLGVGLAVVKGLVEMHGGEVRAASEGLGHGSEITLFLPLDQSAIIPQAPAFEAGDAPVPTAGHRRILVVEDLDELLVLVQCGERARVLAGREPRVTLDGLRMSRKHMYFSSAKAQRELGYTWRDPRVAIREAIDWFKGEGYLR